MTQGQFGRHGRQGRRQGKTKRDDRDSFAFLFCINLLNFRELIRNSLAWLSVHPITSAILLEKVLTSLITSIGARSLSISSWENWPPYWILKVEEDLEERWFYWRSWRWARKVCSSPPLPVYCCPNHTRRLAVRSRACNILTLALPLGRQLDRLGREHIS